MNTLVCEGYSFSFGQARHSHQAQTRNTHVLLGGRRGGGRRPRALSADDDGLNAVQWHAHFSGRGHFLQWGQGPIIKGQLLLAVIMFLPEANDTSAH